MEDLSLSLISIQVKKTKRYLLKLPNKTSSPSCISGTACFIIFKISLFVTAANRKGILLVTYKPVWRRSLGGTGGESVN